MNYSPSLILNGTKKCAGNFRMRHSVLVKVVPRNGLRREYWNSLARVTSGQFLFSFKLIQTSSEFLDLLSQLRQTSKKGVAPLVFIKRHDWHSPPNSGPHDFSR